MFFLLRLGFWFALVLLLLPLGRPEGTPEVSPLEAASAAGQAIRDVAGLCERQPEVCVTGKAALETIGSRASDTARAVSKRLDGAFEDNTSPAAAPVPLPTPRPKAPVAP